ncbi:MAG: chemotaxis protein CheB [Deltaproteobacteria bacterium]|nr:chemotaxis protein CheB [Deltaproteobacteria bacterium]
MTPSLVVVGASLGGLNALRAIMGGLPRDFPLPIVVVQHRSRDGDGTLTQFLQGSSALPVCEPDDKEPLSPGRIYMAPADYHLLVESGNLACSTDAPVNFSRPSIDVLFDSAAEAYGSGVVGVILSGSNADGAAGAARIAHRGGIVIVEDPSFAEAAAMPAAALAAAPRSHVARLAEIAPLLMRVCCDRERTQDHG